MPRQVEQLVQGCTAATWSSQDQSLAGHLEPGPCPHCHGSPATQRSTLQMRRQSLELACGLTTFGPSGSRDRGLQPASPGTAGLCSVPCAAALRDSGLFHRHHHPCYMTA